MYCWLFIPDCHSLVPNPLPVVVVPSHHLLPEDVGQGLGPVLILPFPGRGLVPIDRVTIEVHTTGDQHLLIRARTTISIEEGVVGEAINVTVVVHEEG